MPLTAQQTWLACTIDTHVKHVLKEGIPCDTGTVVEVC